MNASRWTRIIAWLATMVVVVGGLTVMFRGGESDRMTVTAHFRRAVGLYVGSSVRVLGVKVGTVRSIKPDGPTVTVVMDVPVDPPIPADATAVIIPPSLVSDRYVELAPVYDGGERLRDGADLDVDHTLTPVELDEILGSLDEFLVALGPKGANATGSLGRLVDVGVKTLGNGGGKDLNATLTNLADAVKTLADNRGDLTGVIQNLASFTDTLARNDSQIRTLSGHLAQATQILAGESDSLAAALKNLSVALGEIASLVHEHSADLGADVKTLAQITGIVVKHKQSLIEALDVLPLGASNIAGTVNTDANTLDIRNDNHQADDPWSVIVCYTLAPILGLSPDDCPPLPPAAAKQQGGPAKAKTAPAPVTAKAREAADVTDRLSLRGLLGGAS